MDDQSFSKSYDPSLVEKSIYKTWEASGYFNPDNLNAAKESFSITMPPPNATGTLHVGHALMLVLQDIMTRYQRMQGKKTLWLPGTDHASIATQNVVEKKLAVEGMTRQQLGRDEFLRKVNEFVETSRDTIKNQIRAMGSSCDWSRERYTLDEQSSAAVREMFVRMFNDELIYRGNRIVHWCPRDTSTLADDEVEYKEVAGKLYHLKYPVKNSDKYIMVATTRPETMFGDVAIAVNPTDERYKDLIGQVVLMPMGNHEIPVIADEYVEKDFGTGALKITPAHDPNDFTIGQKYHLKTLRVINETGHITLADLASEPIDLASIQRFEGMDRMQAREEVIAELLQKNLVEKIEDYTHSVGFCYRCNTLIEPLISLQWFIAVDKKIPGRDLTLKELSHRAVASGDIKMIPERFEKTYFQWIDNLHDWCISRQIWFGHQIPVYYCETVGCHETVAAVEAPKVCPKCKNTTLRQDEDTLDTWFSSGLWTFSTLGWPNNASGKVGAIKKTGDLAAFHPTSVLETGYDILPFWVARMILMSEYALGEPPFKTVYLHGLVLDARGKKMSKSHAETTIDPIAMIDKYGTDALRVSMVSGIAPGNDVRLFEEKIEGNRNLVNKLWNISRFILTQTTGELKKVEQLSLTDQWIISRLHATVESVSGHLDRYEFSQAIEDLRIFTWDEFADWYIEIAKIEGNKSTLLVMILENLLALWHPILPFVTEQIYQQAHEVFRQLEGTANTNLLMVHAWPHANTAAVNTTAQDQHALLREIIQVIRNARAEYHIPPAQHIQAIMYTPYHNHLITSHDEVIKRLARLNVITVLESGERPGSAIFLKVKDVEVYLPLGMLGMEEEIGRLQKELAQLESLITNLSTKLKDPEFTGKAPKRVVEIEQDKLTQYQDKVVKIKEQIARLTTK